TPRSNAFGGLKTSHARQRTIAVRALPGGNTCGSWIRRGTICPRGSVVATVRNCDSTQGSLGDCFRSRAFNFNSSATDSPTVRESLTSQSCDGSTEKSPRMAPPGQRQPIRPRNREHPRARPAVILLTKCELVIQGCITRSRRRKSTVHLAPHESPFYDALLRVLADWMRLFD